MRPPALLRALLPIVLAALVMPALVGCGCDDPPASPPEPPAAGTEDPDDTPEAGEDPDRPEPFQVTSRLYGERSGRALAGALVRVTDTDGRTADAVTGDGGDWSVRAPLAMGPATLAIMPSPGSTICVHRSVELELFDGRLPYQTLDPMRVPVGGWVDMLVMGPDGAPVADATVTYEIRPPEPDDADGDPGGDPDGDGDAPDDEPDDDEAADGERLDHPLLVDTPQTTTTTDAGRLFVPYLRPTEHLHITITKPGFRTRVLENVTVRDGEPTARELTLPRRGRVTGTVRDDAGRPLAGAEVFYVRRQQDGDVWRLAALGHSTVTGEDGTFSLPLDSWTNLRLHARAPGWAEGALELDDGEPGMMVDDVTIRLQPGGSISGTYVTEDGAPVAGRLRVRPTDDPSWPDLWVDTEPDGSFTVDMLVPERTYAIGEPGRVAEHRLLPGADPVRVVKGAMPYTGEGF